MDVRVDHGAGALDLLDQGKEDLTVALAELLDDGRRLLVGAGYDLIFFFTAVGLLFGFVFSNRILSNRSPPPAHLQLFLGHPLAWSVTDSAGNTQGIGSRVFFVQN